MPSWLSGTPWRPRTGSRPIRPRNSDAPDPVDAARWVDSCHSGDLPFLLVACDCALLQRSARFRQLGTSAARVTFPAGSRGVGKLDADTIDAVVNLVEHVADLLGNHV